jgi:hypothetical protein
LASGQQTIIATYLGDTGSAGAGGTLASGQQTIMATYLGSTGSGGAGRTWTSGHQTIMAPYQSCTVDQLGQVEHWALDSRPSLLPTWIVLEQLYLVELCLRNLGGTGSAGTGRTLASGQQTII